MNIRTTNALSSVAVGKRGSESSQPAATNVRIVHRHPERGSITIEVISGERPTLIVLQGLPASSAYFARRAAG